MPASLAAFSIAAQPPSTIRSASETFLPPAAAPLNSSWMPSSFCSTFASCAGWFTSQSFCGARRMRAPLAPPRLSRPRNVEADAQAVDDQLRDGQPRGEDLRLRARDVLLVDQRMIDGGNRVLPDQLFLRHQRAEVARDRPHVAVRELEPGAGEGVGELRRDARGSAARSSRRRGRSAARGRSSASSARASSTDRGRPG